MELEKNKCCAGDCKWRSQEPLHPHCSHPKAKKYKPIKEPCKHCKRKPDMESGGCGACIGRGSYIYHTAYEDCDCGGYEAEK